MQNHNWPIWYYLHILSLGTSRVFGGVGGGGNGDDGGSCWDGGICDYFGFDRGGGNVLVVSCGDVKQY